MKRVEFALYKDIERLAFPMERIKSRMELLTLLLETLRFSLTDKPLANVHNSEKFLFYVADMQRLFFYKENKYISISLPFSLYQTDAGISFAYDGIVIDSEIISNILRIINDTDLGSDSIMDMAILVDEVKKINIWKIIRHLMTYEIGYIRYDDDIIGYKDAKKNGCPLRHPRFHLDICLAQSATFKVGLERELSNDEFIQILDNKVDRWFLKKINNLRH